jgi:hypothetical protein
MKILTAPGAGGDIVFVFIDAYWELFTSDLDPNLRLFGSDSNPVPDPALSSVMQILDVFLSVQEDFLNIGTICNQQ